MLAPLLVCSQCLSLSCQCWAHYCYCVVRFRTVRVRIVRVISTPSLAFCQCLPQEPEGTVSLAHVPLPLPSLSIKADNLTGLCQAAPSILSVSWTSHIGLMSLSLLSQKTSLCPWKSSFLVKNASMRIRLYSKHAIAPDNFIYYGMYELLS